MNSDNILNIYMYTMTDGGGSQLKTCLIPPPNNGIQPINNDCLFFESYTEVVSGFTTTDKGFDLNVIQVRKNVADNSKFDIKIGAGDWVINFFYFKIIYFFIF